MHGNLPVASMRRCVITCCPDKSDRIGIETCYVFHCAAESSLDIFGTAVFAHEKKDFAGKFRCNTPGKAQLKQLFRKYPYDTAAQ